MGLRRKREQHGMCGTPVYNCWKSMISRCYIKSATGYADYGARGIVVCAAWRDSFSTFFADMGSPPTPTHSIERLNVNGNYTKENCCWATDTEQMRNTRRTVRYAACGAQLTAMEWSERGGVPEKTIMHRLVLGWPVEDAVSIPSRAVQPPRLLTRNGVTQSLMTWSRQLGIGHHTLRQRVRRGLSDEEVLQTASFRERPLQREMVS